jgi:hypothetical protein
MIATIITFVVLGALGVWVLSKASTLIKLGGLPLALLVSCDYFIFVIAIALYLR